jgi:RHS repeat-associated protein
MSIRNVIRLLCCGIAFTAFSTLAMAQGTVSPASLTFHGIVSEPSPGSNGPASQTLSIGAPAGAAWTASATTASGGLWLVTSQPSGMGPETIIVAVNPIALPAGNYVGQIVVAFSASTQTIPVVLSLTGGVFGVSPSSLSFQAAAGGLAPAAQSLALSMGSSGTLPIITTWTVTVATASGGNWLAVTPVSGSGAATITVFVNSASLAAGTYTGTVTLTPASGVAVAVPVTLTVGGQAAMPYIGAEPPCACRLSASGIGPLVQERSDTGTTISRTEGNLTERVLLSRIMSASGPTISFALTYNSYDADGTHSVVDSAGLGYGWTHSYNIFLFQQAGSMFRYGSDGRVTEYTLNSTGTYTAAPGYFETLVQNADGSFTLTQKGRTVFTFAVVPNSSIQSWRLIRIADPNNNQTNLTYTMGNLTGITDTYGQSLTLAYNSHNSLVSVGDPAGRMTKLGYYSENPRELTEITDPLDNYVLYGYNESFQLTYKADKDGRFFQNEYVNGKPVAVYDSSGTALATLSNPGNWATDPVALANGQIRAYQPAITSNTDGRGNVWQYQGDSNGYVTSVVAPDQATTSYTYDPATLMVSSKTDANGNTSKFVYDGQGNMIQAIDAMGNVTAYTYEPVFNMMTSMTDARGRVSTYSHDNRGNITLAVDPLGQTQSWTYDPHGNPLTYTDQNGHTKAYQYDPFGNVSQITDQLGFVTTMTHDPVGNMVSRVDANGHAFLMQFDGLNQITQVTDAAGNLTVNAYNGEGDIVKVVNPNGNPTTYVYDERRRRSAAIDALGNSENYTYDTNDNEIAKTDTNTHRTNYVFDVQNRLVETVDPLGNKTETGYDPAGNVVSRTDANKHATTFTNDKLNRLIMTKDAAGDVTSLGYDTGATASCGVVSRLPARAMPGRGLPPVGAPPLCGATPGSSLITQEKDPNGKVTYFKYDPLSRQIFVVRKVGDTSDTITADDAVSGSTYDPASNVMTTTAPDGNTTAYVYDKKNERVKMVNAAGDVTLTTFDGVGNETVTTTPNLNVIAKTYDALDRLIQVSDSIGLVARYTYDPDGNRISQTDGNLNTILTAYDVLDRPVAVTDALGKVTTSVYDNVGNLVQVADRAGNVTANAYDGDNRLISTTNALGNVTQTVYDAVGNVVQRIDGNKNATKYTFDVINRLTQEAYADGKTRAFTYDGVGNIVTRTDQIGQTTTYSYNDLYYLLSRSYSVGGVNDTMTYDLSGRMLTAQRGSWPVSFTYDGANRIVATTQNGRSMSFVYNIPGRTRTVTYPGGRVVTENTDARQRLDHTVDAASAVPIVQYNYDLGNRVTTRGYRNGTSAAYSYNANNWTLGLQHSFGTTPIAGFGYAYDNEGNKQYEQKLQDTVHSEAYQYDSIYELVNYKVGALAGATIASPSTQSVYSLDPVGNWNSKATNGVTQTRQNNAVNEVLQIGTENLSYDANGNLSADATYTYLFDPENRLTQVTPKSSSAAAGQYTYDALGRRVNKGGSNGTFYFYDGARILEEQNSAGATQATYVYGNYVDEVLTMNRGSQTYYYHQNALWSVEAVTDSTGNVAERYSYDAYGLPAVTNGTGTPVPPNSSGTAHSAIGNPWMFTGRQDDEETGLYFYRARYIDPNQGRFVSRDPIGIWGRPGGLGNGYAYVGNSPSNHSDPSGQFTICYDSNTNIVTVTCVDGTGETLDASTASSDQISSFLLGAPAFCQGHGGLVVETPVLAAPGRSGVQIGTSVGVALARPYTGPVASLNSSTDGSTLFTDYTPFASVTGTPIGGPLLLTQASSGGVGSSVISLPTEPAEPPELYCLFHPSDEACLDLPVPGPIPAAFQVNPAVRDKTLVNKPIIKPIVNPSAETNSGSLQGLGVGIQIAVRDKTLVVTHR